MVIQSLGVSLVVQRLKHLPAMWETWVWSLGWEDPLEKEMATHSSILAWRIPCMEEVGGLQSMGRKESDTTEQLHFHLDCKKIQSVHPKGHQSWIFIGRIDVEAETQILWPPEAKRWLIWKDPDAGKDWRWKKKGKTEDKMVGWHHQLNGHEFESTLGVGDGQGGLACCSPWGHKESDTTERLNWTELTGNNYNGNFKVSCQAKMIFFRGIVCKKKKPLLALLFSC